jgi:hypothetical protein
VDPVVRAPDPDFEPDDQFFAERLQSYEEGIGAPIRKTEIVLALALVALLAWVLV